MMLSDLSRFGVNAWFNRTIFTHTPVDIATSRYKLPAETWLAVPAFDQHNWPSTAPEYRWESLQSASHIRLVHLYPAQYYTDTPVVRILTYSRDAVPQYTALSYHWGDPRRVHDIAVLSSGWAASATAGSSSGPRVVESNARDYERASIHHNLFLALQRLRRKDRPVLVWTDFLCINQDDIPEKNAQVLRMHEIYQLAASTTVYLGEASPDDHSDKLDRILPQITDWMENGFLESKHRERYAQNMSQVAFRELADSRLFLEAITIEERWRQFQVMLRAFFSRPWFRRVWVVQEVEPAMKRNGKSLHTLCGDQDLDWDEIGWAYLITAHMPLTNVERDQTGHAPVWQLIEKSKKSLNLFELLCHSQELSASDPRDHCFALLGMSGQVEAPVLRPDYRSSVKDVFMQYTRFLIDQGFGQRLLLRSNKYDFATQKVGRSYPDLPSWAPDWSAPTLYEMPFTQRPHQVYAAGGPSLGYFHVREENVLVTRGFFFDTPLVARHLRGSDISDFDRFEGSIRVDLKRVDWACKFLMHYMSQYWNGAWFDGNIASYLIRFLVGDLVPPSSGRLQRILPAAHDTIAALVNRDLDRVERHLKSHEVQLYLWIMSLNLSRSSLAVTGKGYFARVPQDIEETDIIAIVLGCDIPLVLSEVRDSRDSPADSELSKLYRIKGWAFVPGIMDGEAVRDPLTNVHEILLV